MRKLKRLSEKMTNADFILGTLIFGFFLMAIIWGVLKIIINILRFIFKL
jgi:hypothetical protein